MGYNLSNYSNRCGNPRFCRNSRNRSVDCKGVVYYLPDSVHSVSGLWSKRNPCLTWLKRIRRLLSAENEYRGLNQILICSVSLARVLSVHCPGHRDGEFVLIHHLNLPKNFYKYFVQHIGIAKRGKAGLFNKI